MKLISIFDTSIATANAGDFIIVDAVKKQLHSIFPGDMFCHLPVHDRLGKVSISANNKSSYSFVAGTNLMVSNFIKYKQWQIGFRDALKLERVLLMGVGWWQYQKGISFFTKKFYENLLSADFIHSVRDDYTRNKLISAGFDNVLNTGCPTTWDLTKEFCKKIPSKKAEKVVFTLTDYNRHEFNDRNLIEILLRNYSEVFFWPQGRDDYEYFVSLGIKDISIISPTLDGYDNFLRHCDDLDYVGTRLHGGVRALQNKKRSIILAVDNRAREMGNDINLPVVDRNNLSKIEDMVINDFETKVNINVDNINQWKRQFK